MKRYILDQDNRPVESSPEEWVKFLDDERRIVRQDTIGGHFISTVFIGAGRPYFETMIFHPDGDGAGGDHFGSATSWEEAVKNHGEALGTLEGIGGRHVSCDSCGLK